ENIFQAIFVIKQFFMRKIYTVLFVFGMIGLQFILSWIFLQIFGAENREKANDFVQIAIDLTYFIAFVLLYFFTRKFDNQYIDKSVPKTILYTILLLTLWLVAPCLVISDFLACDFSKLLKIHWSDQNNELSYNLIRTVLFVPILEEFIFRKYLFNYLTKSRKQIPFSIIIMSLLFSLIHLDFDYFLYYFLSGVFLSLIYLTSRTIIIPIIIHILINVLVLYLLPN